MKVLVLVLDIVIVLVIVRETVEFRVSRFRV